MPSSSEESLDALKGRRPRAVDALVSRRVRARRLELGLSSRELGALVGVTYQQMHKYETGLNRISVGMLHVLSRVLQVEVDYMFEGAAELASDLATVDPERLGRAQLEFVRTIGRITDRASLVALGSLTRILAGSAQTDRELEDDPTT